MTDSLILNYHDACIYQSDIDLLESDTAWLNDACIHFQMNRLDKAFQKHHVTKPKPNAATPTASTNSRSCNNECDCTSFFRASYLDPSVVSFFMYHISNHDHEEMVDLCRTWGLVEQGAKLDTVVQKNAETCRMWMIMVPVNDYHAASSWSAQIPGGGNHWSLLAVIILFPLHKNATTTTSDDNNPAKNCVDAEKFRMPNTTIFYMHFDSSRGTNGTAALKVAKKLNRILSFCFSSGVKEQAPNAVKSMTVNGNSVSQISHGEVLDTCRMDIVAPENIFVTECETPQQQNGHDCGICTIAAAEALTSVNPKESGYFDLYPSIDTFYEESDGESKRPLFQEAQLKKWLEQRLSKFVYNKYGGLEKMAREMRRNIAADIFALKDKNIKQAKH